MTTALRLYQHVDALEVVRAWIDEHSEEIIAFGGELPPALAELCDAVEQGLTDKAEAVALYIRELESTADAIMDESERLMCRAKHYERAAKGLKAYLLMQLQRADIPKIEGKLITVARQKSPPSVQGTLSQDALLLIRNLSGRGFVETIPEQYRLNAREVIAAWKDGTPLPPGVTVTQNEHIRIR